MNKETLEKRLAEIASTKDQTIANLNYLTGQENELKHWLAELAKGEIEEPKLPNNNPAVSDSLPDDF